MTRTLLSFGRASTYLTTSVGTSGTTVVPLAPGVPLHVVGVHGAQLVERQVVCRGRQAIKDACVAEQERAGADGQDNAFSGVETRQGRQFGGCGHDVEELEKKPLLSGSRCGRMLSGSPPGWIRMS